MFADSYASDRVPSLWLCHQRRLQSNQLCLLWQLEAPLVLYPSYSKPVTLAHPNCFLGLTTFTIKGNTTWLGLVLHFDRLHTCILINHTP